MKQKPPSPSVLRALGSLGGLGFTFAIPTALGAIVGTRLEGYFHTGPWIIIICLVVGLIVGGLGVYGLLKTVLRNGF